jgi:hypothetical protein
LVAGQQLHFSVQRFAAQQAKGSLLHAISPKAHVWGIRSCGSFFFFFFFFLCLASAPSCPKSGASVVLATMGMSAKLTARRDGVERNPLSSSPMRSVSMGGLLADLDKSDIASGSSPGPYPRPAYSGTAVRASVKFAYSIAEFPRTQILGHMPPPIRREFDTHENPCEFLHLDSCDPLRTLAAGRGWPVLARSIGTRHDGVR